jgi:hypothetical protein
MSEADQRLLGSGLEPGPWEDLEATVWRNMEIYFKEIEQRRFPDGPIVQGPSNDEIMGATVVV